MKKILMLLVLLSGSMFYTLNENADLLKTTFGKTSIISSYNEAPKKQQIEFTMETVSENKRLTCYQVEGVIYCPES